MTPFAMIARLAIAAACNLFALVLLLAWAYGLPAGSVKGAIAAAVVGWCMLPDLREVDAMIDAMKRHIEDSRQS